VDFAQTGDAQALVFPEIGVAVVGGAAAQEHGITADEFVASDSAAHSVDPEYFMFATHINPADYLKGVIRTAEMISEDLGSISGTPAVAEMAVASLGVTWGLAACKVPASHFDAQCHWVHKFRYSRLTQRPEMRRSMPDV
jgi:hypothetical protein